MLEIDPKERKRLATESRLVQKQRELVEANNRIAEKAKELTDEVIERRTEAERARSEAERARTRHLEAVSNLRQAKSETSIVERRLWGSIESIADGFGLFDRDRKVVAANTAFFAPFEDIEDIRLGVTYDRLVDIAIEEGLVDPGGLTRRGWAEWMKERWSAKTIQPIELRLWNNQFIRITERRTRDGDVVMMGTNITRQMRRQKVLEESRRRAETASRAKSAFLANMSHEIRTPMNGVLAMADLLAESELDEEQGIYLDTIRSSGQALLVIINDVLDYSKIEAQKIELEIAPFDLEAAINEVTTLLMPSAREKGLSLNVDYDMFLPTLFHGDKGRIRQILMNLLGNAVKFTEEGHVTVQVVGLPDEEPDHFRLHITVEDTGIGVPENKRDHIFGEFNQAQSEMTRQFDGTGLGLAITKRLVDLMGGEIWVDAGAECGSVFGFRVTLRSDGPELDDLTAQFGSRRVLLQDPVSLSRDIMVKQLRALGLTPETVEDVSSVSVNSEDLVMICDDRSLQGTVQIGSGAQFEETGHEMPRPLLRQTLLDALSQAIEDMPQATTDAPPAFSSRRSNDQDLQTPIAPEKRRVRVLAAEDNKTNRLVLQKLLKSLDIDLILVENGRLAVESFQAEPPDIVFTDISMPEMNGMEAARAMRDYCRELELPAIPIIAMTAHADDGNRQEVLASGIDHYLIKPLKKDILIEHILDAAPEEALPPLA